MKVQVKLCGSITKVKFKLKSSWSVKKVLILAASGRQEKKYSNWAGTEAPRFSFQPRAVAACRPFVKMIAKLPEQLPTIFLCAPVNSNMFRWCCSCHVEQRGAPVL